MRSIKVLILFSFLVSGIDAAAQTLQQVTDNGATTSNGISAASVTANSASLAGVNLPTNISLLNGYRINGSIPDASHNGITYQSGGGGGAAITFFRGGSYDTGMDFYTNYNGNHGDLQHRMRIASNGNVGIGTANPQSILHLVGNGSDKDLGNFRYNNQGFIIEAKSGGRSLATGASLEFVIPAGTDGFNEWGQGRIMTVADNLNNGDATGKMIMGTRRLFNKMGTGNQWYYGDDLMIDGAGNVGVGEVMYSAKLNINSGVGLTTLRAIGSNGYMLINNVGSGESYFQANVAHRFQGTSSNEVFTILSGGNVGIGNSNPGDKLAVNGNIRAREVKVENANWPDYVFSKSHKLPTLDEIERHIKTKGHLQDIPSAAEVKANGIDLGEMNAKLLQKIEELTLYLIEKDKTDKEQQLKIEQLQKQLASILAKDK